MKLDYEFIKQILIVMEENETHEIGANNLLQKLQLDESLKDKFIGHIKILDDNACIDCDDSDLGFKMFLGGEVAITNCSYRLTSYGYEFLDVLRNDTVLNKVKSFALPTAFEVGKQLLVQLLTGQLT